MDDEKQASHKLDFETGSIGNGAGINKMNDQSGLTVHLTINAQTAA